MLPPRCRKPPCRNIEVIKLSQGHGMPYTVCVTAESKRLRGTKPSEKKSASPSLWLNISCQKKVTMQASMIPQVTIGVSRVGFSSEMGIIGGQELAARLQHRAMFHLTHISAFRSCRHGALSVRGRVARESRLWERGGGSIHRPRRAPAGKGGVMRQKIRAATNCCANQG